MKIITMREIPRKQHKRFRIVKEMYDGYLIHLYKYFDYGKQGTHTYISICMRLSVDELFDLQDEHAYENIKRFNVRFEQVLTDYTRRNLK